MALCLARAGADVVVTGSGTKSRDHLPADERESDWRGAESIAEEVRALGVRSLAIHCDVRHCRLTIALLNSKT